MKTAPLLVALLGGFLLSGCSSAPAPPVRTWDFPVEAPAPSTSLSADAPYLQIARVQAESWLQGLCIRRPDGRFDTLVYERLVAPWPELVEVRLRQALASTGKFRAVLADSHPAQSGWNLLVRIARAEIDETAAGGVHAEVAYELSLFAPAGALHAVTRIDARRKLESPAVEGLVATLGGAVLDANRATAAWVESALPR